MQFEIRSGSHAAERSVVLLLVLDICNCVKGWSAGLLKREKSRIYLCIVNAQNVHCYVPEHHMQAMKTPVFQYSNHVPAPSSETSSLQ